MEDLAFFACALAFLLVAYGLLVLCIRAFLSLYRVLSLAVLPTRWGFASVYYVYGSLWRQFVGPGDVTFEEGSISLSGTVTADLLSHLLFILCVYAALVPMAPGGQAMTAVALVLAIVSIVCDFIRLFVANRKRTVVLTASDLRSVKCAGPVVKLRFASSGVPRLKKAAFLVDSQVRTAFFMAFEKTLPGTLPIEYISAVESVPVYEAFDALERSRGEEAPSQA